ncbi:hypothetical protein BKA82DRAFT_2823056 [Pisolithus tinctorius]|nr:hypothetical protein BKA82DRAFT_2823056 [Pisolithus tinctorius]
MLAHGPATFLLISLIIHLSVLIARNVSGSGLASSFTASTHSYILGVLSNRVQGTMLPFAIYVTSIVAMRFSHSRLALIFSFKPSMSDSRIR